MREFILFARKALTKPFDLNNLPKANRMDVIARCITNALFVSYAIRKDTNFYVSLNGPPNPPVLIKFIGNEIQNIYLDERSIAEKINKALKKVNPLKEVKVSEGIYVSKKSFESFLKEKGKEKKFILLDRKGKDLRNFNFKGNELFIIGDHKGFPKTIEKFIKKFGSEKISLGPLDYLSSHCIILIHNELDRKRIH